MEKKIEAAAAHWEAQQYYEAIQELESLDSQLLGQGLRWSGTGAHTTLSGWYARIGSEPIHKGVIRIVSAAGIAAGAYQREGYRQYREVRDILKELSDVYLKHHALPKQFWEAVMIYLTKDR